MLTFLTSRSSTVTEMLLSLCDLTVIAPGTLTCTAIEFSPLPAFDALTVATISDFFSSLIAERLPTRVTEIFSVSSLLTAKSFLASVLEFATVTGIFVYVRLIVGFMLYTT